jgi:AAHS family benzoate transporter-like MFS transporter
MAGLLISGLLAGQMADAVGRKPTFYLSILLMGLFNTCAALSVSWEMFAVFRFFIGVSCGMYLATVHISLIEFIPVKTRAMVCALPSWPVYAAAYGLLSYLLHDWKSIHFATAISTVPLLPTFWYAYTHNDF